MSGKQSRHREFSVFQIIKYSIPASLSSLVGPLASVVDTSLIGHLGSHELAALSLCVSVIESFGWLLIFLVHGPTGNISFYLGQKKYEMVGKTIKVSLFSALSTGILASIFLFFTINQIWDLYGADSQLRSLATDYMNIRLLALPLSILLTSITGILRGLDLIVRSLVLSSITTILNFIISFILIYHFKMGLAGAGLGTLISLIIGVVLGFGQFFIGERARLFKLHSLNFFEVKIWKNFSKDSISLLGRSAFLVSSFFIATIVATRLGHIQLATHQIVLQLWLFSSYFIDGIAITGNIQVALFLGEGNQQKSIHYIKKTLVMSLGIGLFFMLRYFLFKDLLVGIFTTDRDIAILFSNIFLPVCLFQFPNALAFVTDGIVFGLRKFHLLALHMGVGFVMLFLPFTYLGYSSSSLTLVWVAMGMLNLFRAVSGLWIIRNYFIVSGSGTRKI